jgi:hypothetical protein
VREDRENTHPRNEEFPPCTAAGTTSVRNADAAHARRIVQTAGDSLMHSMLPITLSRFKLSSFLCHILPFFLFKIVIQIYIIICYISNFFSDKTYHNKIYDFYNVFD